MAFACSSGQAQLSCCEEHTNFPFSAYLRVSHLRRESGGGRGECGLVDENHMAGAIVLQDPRASRCRLSIRVGRVGERGLNPSPLAENLLEYSGRDCSMDRNKGVVFNKVPLVQYLEYKIRKFRFEDYFHSLLMLLFGGGCFPPPLSSPNSQISSPAELSHSETT